MEEEKDITINELAIIINKGFQSQMDYMEKRFDELVTKKDFNELKTDVDILKGDVKFLKENAEDATALTHRVEYMENVLNISPIKK